MVSDREETSGVALGHSGIKKKEIPAPIYGAGISQCLDERRDDVAPQAIVMQAA